MWLTNPTDRETATGLLSAMAFRLSLTRPLCVVDLETTGLRPDLDRIVEIAIARVAPGGLVATFDALVNPQIAIPAAATAVHGIRDEDVIGCPAFKGLARQVADFIGDGDFLGYNMRKFDLRMLCKEFEHAGVPFDPAAHQIIDPCQIFFRREPRDLAGAVQFFCGMAYEGHRAMRDVWAAIAVFSGQLERYPDLPTSVAALHPYCENRDPSWLDADGKIVWCEGEARLAFSKHQGRSLRELARLERSFLNWMLTKDFAPDTTTIIREALKGTFPAGPL